MAPAAEAEQLPLTVPDTMPWRFGRYPRIDAALLRERLALFGVDMPEYQADTLARAHRAARDAHVGSVVIYAVLVAFVSAAVVSRLLQTGGADEWLAAIFVGEWPFWLAWLVTAAPFLVLLVLKVRTRVRTPGLWHRMRGAERSARHRFFLRAGMTFASGYHVVVTQNLIGLAARGLFVSLQRRRWTWTSPPAVADRALRLTQPLLDIAVDDGPSRNGQAIFSFLNDVVVLVVAGREDLIPAVRARYTMIPRRSGETGEISERDILYLDPMRNRGRWEVVKDFVLPLASWISLVVSVIALLVAVTR